ncbi:MAG: hypothetical protein HQK53_14870 [Oligoflexia bacterium]|nr:hypothetical protein [Oligoflexia bacterium]
MKKKSGPVILFLSLTLTLLFTQFNLNRFSNANAAETEVEAELTQFNSEDSTLLVQLIKNSKLSFEIGEGGLLTIELSDVFCTVHSVPMIHIHSKGCSLTSKNSAQKVFVPRNDIDSFMRILDRAGIEKDHSISRGIGDYSYRMRLKYVKCVTWATETGEARKAPLCLFSK